MKTRTPQIRVLHEVVPDDTDIGTDTASEFRDPMLGENLHAMQAREHAARDRREELARLRDVARFD